MPNQCVLHFPAFLAEMTWNPEEFRGSNIRPQDWPPRRTTVTPEPTAGGDKELLFRPHRLSVLLQNLQPISDENCMHSPPPGVVVSTPTLAQSSPPKAAKQPPLTLGHSAQWLQRKPMARARPVRVPHASPRGQGDWPREGHVIRARPTNQRLPEQSEASRISAGAGCSEDPGQMAGPQERQGQKQGAGGTVRPESPRAVP